MANLVITPANVNPGAGAKRATGALLAGEALTAGTPVYQKASDKRLYKADCNTATTPEAGKTHPPEAAVIGITLNPADVGQPVALQNGGEMNLGAVLVQGAYYVLSATPGAICPIADLVAASTPPQNVIVLGQAKTTAIFVVKIDLTGIAV
jgi:hypothetical protein